MEGWDRERKWRIVAGRTEGKGGMCAGVGEVVLRCHIS